MASILQLIEQTVETQVAILPLIDAEIAALASGIPTVAQTPAIHFKVGAHTYSFVGVFNKVS